MKKIFLGLTLLIVVVLAACCSNTRALAADTSWDDIKAKGYFLVTRSDGYSPMSFRDAGNKNVGFDVDLADAVGRYLGIEARPFIADWASKFIVLDNGDADCIWCGFSITKDRLQQVIFTDPYLNDMQYIVVAANSSINNKADIAGKTLAWQMGSSCENAIKADPIYAQLKDTRTYNTMPDALQDMINGRVDAVVIDSVYFNYYAQESGTSDRYRVLEDNFGDDFMAVGVRLGDKAWGEKLNEALNAVMVSEEGIAIAEKWFGRNVFEEIKRTYDPSLIQ